MFKKLDTHVTEMRSFGEQLMRYTYPIVDKEVENDVGILKTREIAVDGYEVVVVYSKANYNTYYQESCQILGRHAPFLPFCVVCDIGQRFLGTEYLSLTELFHDNRKVYCWTVSKDLDNQATPCQQEVEVESCNYEGFKYSYMNPKHVNFY